MRVIPSIVLTGLVFVTIHCSSRSPQENSSRPPQSVLAEDGYVGEGEASSDVYESDFGAGQRVESPSEQPVSQGWLTGIVIAPQSHAETYVRKDWPHWRDEDSDCQDARDEVLVAESLMPVGFKGTKSCEVVTGQWRCAYTGEVIRSARKLAIDHVVPLQNAHVSGGWRWSSERRERYANELDDPIHLVAVTASSNRAKGAKGPDAWLPHIDPCGYVEAWVQIKRIWRLSMTEVEAAKVREVEAQCR